ncbi:MAG TPA: response regulator [Acidimicrobiales bacterium]|nr:response regulator [Acidimicrobiales bacterium]
MPWDDGGVQDEPWSDDPELRAMFEAEAATRLAAIQGGEDVLANAHDLAGAAGVMGFGAISELARTVERTAREGGDTTALVASLADAVDAVGGVRIAAPPAVEAVGAGTVLVVDDAAPVRALLRTVLEAGGHDVVEAEDGEQALTLLDGVAVVITDVQMPKLDGLGLLAAIDGRVPVIVLTAEGDVPGAAATMAKQGFDPAALLATVAAAISG